MSYFSKLEVVGSKFPHNGPDVLFSTLYQYGDKETHNLVRCLALGVMGVEDSESGKRTGLAHISPGIARGVQVEQNPGYIDLVNWLSQYSQVLVNLVAAGGVVGNLELNSTDVDLPVCISTQTDLYGEMNSRVHRAVVAALGSGFKVDFRDPTHLSNNQEFNGLSVKVASTGVFSVIHQRKIGSY